jgi:opacity protein-like surface antigen
MTKINTIILLAILTSSFANAQFTKIGGGLTYGTGFHFNNVTTPQDEADLHRGPFAGIFLTGIYELNRPIHIAPSLTYFLPRTNKPTQAFGGEGTRVSEMMFDLNGHYVFNSLDRFEFYGLAGLNITFARIKWIGTPSGNSDNAIGLNLGVGTYMKMTEQLDLFVEGKYIVSKYDQFMLNIGVLINLDWLKKNENPGI